MEGNMVRLMRRCQLAKSTKEAARALEGKVRIIQDDYMHPKHSMGNLPGWKNQGDPAEHGGAGVVQVDPNVEHGSLGLLCRLYDPTLFRGMLRFSTEIFRILPDLAEL